VLLAPGLAKPAAAIGSRQVLGALARRATVLGAATLSAALVAVYAGAAFTLPAGHGGLALALGGVAGAQLVWVLALLRLGARRAVLTAGAALELALAAVWLLSRTVGLPGQSALPVGELDVMCLADELIVASLAFSGLRVRAPRSSLRALGPCQLAVTLAGATLFAWGAGHAHGAAVRASASGIQFGSAAHVRYYCHLL
jgi:hypothetical protein